MTKEIENLGTDPAFQSELSTLLDLYLVSGQTLLSLKTTKKKEDNTN